MNLVVSFIKDVRRSTLLSIVVIVTSSDAVVKLASIPKRKIKTTKKV